MYRISPQLSEKIKHFATFPQTGVSLRQMVMFGKGQLLLLIPSYKRHIRILLNLLSHVSRSFLSLLFSGQNPTQGTLFKASQFLSEELPIRLAHRVKELEELPHNLSDMPSIIRVKNWYAQSFQVQSIPHPFFISSRKSGLDITFLVSNSRLTMLNKKQTCSLLSP